MEPCTSSITLGKLRIISCLVLALQDVKRERGGREKGSSLQQVLVMGKDLKGLNSILSDYFSLLPIVLGLFRWFDTQKLPLSL